MKIRQFGEMIICLFVVALGGSTLANAESRTWKDSTGAFSIVAEFLELRDGKVRLKKDDGQVVEVPIDRLSSGDQQYIRSKATRPTPSTVATSALTGKTTELKNDDGTPAGKKSLPRGVATAFEAPDQESFVTLVKIHGSRYGYPKAPKEDFRVSLCDKDFKLIKQFKFPYSKFARGNPKWVTLRLRPTRVPSEFIICLDFKPERTKGVYVSHDGEGVGLVGLPENRAGSFSGGDWLVRAVVDRLK